MRIDWTERVRYRERDSTQTRSDTVLRRECMAQACIQAVRDMGIREEAGTEEVEWRTRLDRLSALYKIPRAGYTILLYKS